MMLFTRQGRFQKSLSLLSEMRYYGFEPDSSSFSKLRLAALLRKGKSKRLVHVTTKLLRCPAFLPSVPAYLSIARGLCRTGEIDSAMMLVRECLGSVESGPMEFKYALRVIHVCKGDKAEKVIEVLDEMKLEGSVIFGMCKHGSIDAAREVFAEIRDRKGLTEDDMVVYDEMLVEHMKKEDDVKFGCRVNY